MIIPQVLLKTVNRPHRHVAPLPAQEIMMQMLIVAFLIWVVLCAVLSQCYWEAKNLKHETIALGKKK